MAEIFVLAGCVWRNELALQYTFIPPVPRRRLVGVVFPGNGSKAELFWVTFLLQNLCISKNVATTPTGALEQLLPRGKESAAAAGDVLLEWEKSCTGHSGDVSQASPNGWSGSATRAFGPLQWSCYQRESKEKSSPIFLELCPSCSWKRHRLNPSSKTKWKFGGQRLFAPL